MKLKSLIGLFLIIFIARGEMKDINLETDLSLIGNGIVITPNEEGIISSRVSLEHGVKKAVSDSEASQVTFIKSTLGNLPSGLRLKIYLHADSQRLNNLVIGASEKFEEKIPHALTGEILSGRILSKDKLEITGSKIEDESELITTDKILAVKLHSKILGEDMLDKKTGNYENTSTLSVKLLAE